MRIVLLPAQIARLFYLGTNYRGSQWQPGLPTVQGDLITALNKWNNEIYTPQSIQISGRTDTGVHSLGQIVMIENASPLDLDQINKYLPEDITLWAQAAAPLGFRPRYDTLMRHYRYYYPLDQYKMDIGAINSALQLLVGTHDFSLLAKPDGERTTNATILNACAFDDGKVLTIDIFGTSFRWRLVRKVVSLLFKIGTTELYPDIISEYLKMNNQISGGIYPAPPEGLILIEAVIPIRMKQSKNALKRIRKILHERQIVYHRNSITISELVTDFISGRRLLF